MDWFAEKGFDTWCVDMEGYGRSDKSRDVSCDISNGADDHRGTGRHCAAERLLARQLVRSDRVEARVVLVDPHHARERAARVRQCALEVAKDGLRAGRAQAGGENPLAGPDHGHMLYLCSHARQYQ